MPSYALSSPATRYCWHRLSVPMAPAVPGCTQGAREAVGYPSLRIPACTMQPNSLDIILLAKLVQGPGGWCVAGRGTEAAWAGLGSWERYQVPYVDMGI